MLFALFIGALSGTKTASTANSFLAAESFVAAHTRNPLLLLGKTGLAANRGVSGLGSAVDSIYTSRSPFGTVFPELKGVKSSTVPEIT